MGQNMIELSTVFQKELDKKMVAASSTGWMEVNDKLVRYEGGSSIKIADITMDGLGNYDRSEGFPKGGVNLKFGTYDMTMDRGRTFSIDSMDVDESNFVMTAGQLLKIFQDTKVVPEVDSYRYSAIAQKAMEKDRCTYGYTPAAASIFENLTNDIAKVQDKIGVDVPLTVSMSVLTANILFNNEKISKSINTMDFKKGEITTVVKAINGVPIIQAPSDRLKTKYVFYNGKDEESKGGFEVAKDALSINWIISAVDAPIAVSKQDNMRIFEPSQNINADAYKIDYRRYHDLWIPTNKLDGIWVNIKEAKPVSESASEKK